MFATLENMAYSVITVSQNQSQSKDKLNSYKRMSLAIRTEMDITSFISTNVIISVISINVKITLTDFAPTVKVSVTRPNLPLMSGEQVTFFFLMIFRLFSSIVAFKAI